MNIIKSFGLASLIVSDCMIINRLNSMNYTNSTITEHMGTLFLAIFFLIITLEYYRWWVAKK